MRCKSNKDIKCNNEAVFENLCIKHYEIQLRHKFRRKNDRDKSKSI